MNHLWQRFLLASSLLVGLAIGVAATVFGYSNLTAVDIHWSVFHINGVPLWTVAVVPIALILVAGTVYHWMDGLHHFTEHMRHRHRVNELEAEVARLRAHLDHVLEMPRSDAESLAARRGAKASLPPADLAAADLEMSGLGSDHVEPIAGADEPEPEPEPAAEAAPVMASEDKPVPTAADGKPGNQRKKRARLFDRKPDTEPEREHTNGVDSEPVPSVHEA